MRLFIAGHNGMVGRALVRRFNESVEIVSEPRSWLDLTNRQAVDAFYRRTRPDAVIVAAAKVGGIYANCTYPADFIRDNLAIALNCIDGAYQAGVKRLLFLGSSCIYPRLAPQPMPESCLLSGPLEPTNEGYAIAKIAGLKLCQFYREQYGVVYHSAMPTNLYGPHDNYHADNSHVVPAMIRRFHDAKEAGATTVTMWGTGSPQREFLHVDDCADACAFLLGMADPPNVANIGTGTDVTIRVLSELVAEAVGYTGRLEWDSSKPDGTPRKLLDMSLLHGLGWRHRIGLEDGLKSAYAAFLRETETGVIRK